MSARFPLYILRGERRDQDLPDRWNSPDPQAHLNEAGCETGGIDGQANVLLQYDCHVKDDSVYLLRTLIWPCTSPEAIVTKVGLTPENC